MERDTFWTVCDFHELRPGEWVDQHGCRLTESTDERGPRVLLYSRKHYHAYRYPGTLAQWLADPQAVMTAF